MFTVISEMKKRDQRGFTLVELLIVIAIIAILAAIALPQFAAYRIRGFNAAANSDVRNAATVEEAAFSDSQGYASMPGGAAANLPVPAGAGTACAVVGGLFVGPLAAAQPAPGVTGAFMQNGLTTVGVTVSNGVSIGTTGTAPGAVSPANTCSAYILVAKHAQGNRCFGRDNDNPGLYGAVGPAGTALAAGDIPVSTIGAVDLGAGAGSCTTWTQL